MEDVTRQQIKEEYIQWLKDTGRMKQQLTDVFINNNGVIKSEKMMAWVSTTSATDWKEFCNIKGIKYDGEINMVAIC